MIQKYPENWPQFYTATIQEWKYVFKTDEYKSVITDALKFLVDNKKIRVNAFVVMDNHVHIIWQALHGFHLDAIKTSFKKHTSKQLLKLLTRDGLTQPYAVTTPDRKHHFWKRNSKEIDLFTEMVFLQKLNYIHQNPVKAGLCSFAEEYKFSSAQFYEKGIDAFGFLEHYKN